MSDHADEDGGGSAVASTGSAAEEREFSAGDLALLDDMGVLADDRNDLSVERELAAIATLRRQDYRAYWRDEKLQARERQLLSTKALDYPIARAAVASVFDAIPPEDRADFERNFDLLPQGARDAIREYLEVPPGYVRPVSEAGVANFASSAEGSELVKEWRGKAAYKIGAIRQRINSMLKAMSPEDGEAAMLWLDNLPGPHAKQVLRVLAG